MIEYKVVWQIDILADTPEKAACQAREIQLNPTTTATVFNIHRNGVQWTQEVDVAEHKPVHFTSPSEQDTYDDLMAKVNSLFHEFQTKLETKVLRLAKSGSGVLGAHNVKRDWLEPRKVMLALLADFTHEEQPPQNLNTKQFKVDVINYYTLL